MTWARRSAPTGCELEFFRIGQSIEDAGRQFGEELVVDVQITQIREMAEEPIGSILSPVVRGSAPDRRKGA